MTIQFVNHTMSGAPTLDGQAGSLTGLLKTCLVDGFGLGTLDSLVVDGGIATATRAAGHSAVAGSMQTIDGATPGGLNGNKRIISATTTSFTFAAPGIADQTATGTITTKVSPLGWTREFNSTNIEVFRSPNPASARHYLRVADSGTTSARVRAFHSMTDVNTGVDPYPTDTQVSGGGWWTKSGQANSTAIHWALIGDDRTFYLVARIGFASYSSGQYANYMAFGDFDSLVPGDAFGSFLQCGEGDRSTWNPNSAGEDLDRYQAFNVTQDFGTFMARSYTGLGVSTKATRRGLFPIFTAAADSKSGQSTGATMAYPNSADGSLFVTRMPFCELTTRHIRGYPRGFYITPQAVGSNVFAPAEEVTGVSGLTGRTLRAFPSDIGVYFFDVTGPW